MNREKKDSVYMCVFLDMCVTVQENQKERKTDRVRLVKGVLGSREGQLACGCVPLYPLFIHSLLSQSLGNETGDRNEDL